MNRILQKQGYDVNAAKSGKEAIDKVSAKFYDLAIIDLNLPDINGLDVYNIITARSPRTKKIILTGLPPEKRGGDTSDEETFDVLVKPLSAEELIQAVKNKLAKPT
jgi:DNA-binding NtrC family response regulator